MRFVICLIFTVTFMFGQIVGASPREDAGYIAKIIFSESSHTENLRKIADQYVFYLTKKLGDHSVKVVDSERFAEMLPETVIEPWLVRWQEFYTDRLSEKIEPAELARIANSVRVMANKTGSSQTADGKDFGNAIIVSVTWIASFMKIADEIEQSLPELDEAPYLADILETNGIFHFPNRIWRKDIIAKIRGGG